MGGMPAALVPPRDARLGRAGSGLSSPAMDADTLPALRRGLRILHLAAQRPGGIGFADLVRILGVGGASLSRLLKVLADEGMLRCDEASGRYRPGPGFEALVAAAGGLGALPALAQPVFTICCYFQITFILSIL